MPHLPFVDHAPNTTILNVQTSPEVISHFHLNGYVLNAAPNPYHFPQ